MYWTLNTTGTAVAPYPTVVCSTTGTFVPPCPSSESSSLCLNVGTGANHSNSSAYSLLQLYPCQQSDLRSNEAFVFLNNRSGTFATGWPPGGCLDSLAKAMPAVCAPPCAPICAEPPCGTVSDSCDPRRPLPSQRWKLAPFSSGSSAKLYHIVHVADQLCLTATSSVIHAGLRLTKCSDTAALQRWTMLPQGHIMLAKDEKKNASATCCDGEYIAPASLGHFAGQDHVTMNGLPQTPYSLPMTGADTGPIVSWHDIAAILVAFFSRAAISC